MYASEPSGGGDPTSRNVAVHRLTGRDVAELDELARAAASVAALDHDDFWPAATTLAQELPRSMRSAVNHFRLTESAPLLLIRGFPVDDRELGPTPAHWLHPPGSPYVARVEAALALCSCLLGDPIGWDSQQDAAVVQNIVPVKGDDWSQISSASQAALTLHTEDAFHPDRGDYVALMCLRNPGAVPTLYACIGDVTLPPATVRLLFEPRFVFRRDDSHAPAAADGSGERRGAGPKAAVLFGAAASPYLRLDSYFMDQDPNDRAATAGLAELEAELSANAASVVLLPGDVLFIDNYRAVHGRAAFTARYDGNDRWLKRTNIVRDLRRSRRSRSSPTARTIFTESAP